MPCPAAVPGEVANGGHKDGQCQREIEAKRLGAHAAKQVFLPDIENAQVYDDPGGADDSKLDETGAKEGANQGQLLQRLD